jgi:hypothetical protein
MAEGFITRRGGVSAAEPITYISATGGTETTYTQNSKNYKVHTFTSSGNFVVSAIGNTPETSSVDYLVIAGGGGGGRGAVGQDPGGGGGGAGGYITSSGTSGANSSANSKISLSTGTFSILVGAGGAGGITDGLSGSFGSTSFALGVATTGGGPGLGISSNLTSPYSTGGSSGGTTFNRVPGVNGIARQGTKGGNSVTGGNQGCGGGGGAGQDGANGTTSRGGNGGNGLANSLRTGANETRAGGGGGANFSATPAGVGGSGGGGNGGTSSSAIQTAGATNTGSGGGGAGGRSGGSAGGGNGGSGIVIIRYEVA